MQVACCFASKCSAAQGHTALHLAAYNGCLEVVCVLLDHGADLARRSHKASDVVIDGLHGVRCRHSGSLWSCSLFVCVNKQSRFSAQTACVSISECMPSIVDLDPCGFFIRHMVSVKSSSAMMDDTSGKFFIYLIALHCIMCQPACKDRCIRFLPCRGPLP